MAYYTIPSVYGGLARYDFTQALALQPKMASVYNYLGLYLLLEEDYDSALETFNAVFELDPSYDYTHLNRGLNFLLRRTL